MSGAYWPVALAIYSLLAVGIVMLIVMARKWP
jgi:hypothetical protein